MGDENCQNLLLMVVSYPCRRIGVDQVVEVHQVQQQQRPMLELVQIWRLPSSLTPSLATCTTFLPCTAPAGLHTSHKYNTSLFIGIFCCILQTSILPNPPLPSLLAMRGYPAATASHFQTLWVQRLPVNHLQTLEVKDFLCYH